MSAAKLAHPERQRRHSRLKAGIAAFNGVATKYLPNYLAWHHVLDRKPDATDHREWLRLAINS
ncbi:MAG: hypothetical protein R3C97_18290 [Geminicoccaceae bacterium]